MARNLNQIGCGRADCFNAPSVLAQSGDPAGGIGSGWKMNVREFADRMTERIINLPQSAIAAVDVGDGDLADMSSSSGGESLHTIADDYNNLRFESMEHFRQRSDRLARRSC